MNFPLRAWLGFSMTMILPIVQTPRLWETTALIVFNPSKESTPGCCSSEWLLQLQQSWCPLVKLVILGLVALPIYNAVLILVGWRLHCSSKSNAERLGLNTRPVKRPAPPPPPPAPPKPPPRVRRCAAIKSSAVSISPTPPRRLIAPETYPIHKNPFGSSPDDQEKYQLLRRNLQLVLRGLQNPPLECAPLRIPEPIVEPSEMASSCPSEYPRSEAQKKRSKVIFKRLWQRWRSRKGNLKKSEKSLASVSSSSGCSTNGSSCFYVYLEET